MREGIKKDEMGREYISSDTDVKVFVYFKAGKIFQWLLNGQ